MTDQVTSPEYHEWQCPPAATSEAHIIGWLNSVTEEGLAWIKSQRGYGDFRKALDTISGRDTLQTTAAYRSHVNTNRLKRNLRQVVGTMAKLRPMWGYHSDNKAYKDQAQMMNQVTKAWYLEAFADRAIKEALQYAAATCRGWVRPIYRRDMYGTGRGDIKLLTYGSPCVVPFQLPHSGDWQSAYAVTILEEMPVAMAHGMFPSFQNRLRPSASRYWYSSDGVRRASQGNLMQRIFGKTRRDQASAELSDLLVPIRYTYVIDLSINTTRAPIPMGEPGSTWAYTVPFVGQDIPMGIDSRSGTMTYRKADENDARLYPRRRCLISSDQVKLYDGPSFDWHGMFPGISFCPDEWPWEPLGFSMVHDGFELNEAQKEIIRGNMDKIRAQLNLPLAFDSNAVSRKEAAAFDPMMPKARISFDGTAIDGEPFKPVVPPEVYRIEPESMEMYALLEKAMDSQMALNEVAALDQSRSGGTMNDLQDAMRASGPIVEDMSRSMEPPMRDLGVMVKYLILQYYTTPRIMQIVGADGVAPEVFDYDPSSIVPSHVAGEDPDRPSAQDRIQRAKTFADNLRFFITPGSLHELTQMVMKLGLIQLRKAGVKIDSQTIAESWAVPNYGDIPGNTVMERWKQEQEMDLEFAARMQQIAGAEGLQQPGAPGPGGQGNPEGRPNSNTAPPQLKSKDNNTRSTITTSK